MLGAIKLFRRRFFGGFDRRDVLSYIEQLGEERNRFREAKENAEAANKKLDNELWELRCKLEHAEIRVREARLEIFDETYDLLSELETACESVRTGIEATSFQIRSELVKVDDSVTMMSSVLHKTNERLGRLRLQSENPMSESECGVESGASEDSEDCKL